MFSPLSLSLRQKCPRIEAAIEEGANLVRIGTKLFGQRACGKVRLKRNAIMWKDGVWNPMRVLNVLTLDSSGGS